MAFWVRFYSRFRSLILTCAASCAFYSGNAAEYEVQGVVRQRISDYNIPVLLYTNEFTIYVRDCGWLIKTIESDGKGHAWVREVGSPNGNEIYEANGTQAFISGTGMPVELLDKGVDGHLWLMFASQCFWRTLSTDQITPIFDWHASVGADPSLKVTGEWQLLQGKGSLPREVEFFGKWDETNAIYTITGTKQIGQAMIPSGFIFEEMYAVPQRGMMVRKRVEAQVTSVRAACSRETFLRIFEEFNG